MNSNDLRKLLESHITYLKSGGQRGSLSDLKSISFRNADLKGIELHGTNLTLCNFNHADLQNANLNYCSMFRTFFIGCNLRGATICSVNLYRAVLTEAILSDTLLFGSNLSETHLAGTKFTGADLRHANIHNAQLKGSDFSGATIGGTNFGNVDLSEVQGLETVEHVGPSSIGFDTMYCSKGKIPESFLRGAGVPQPLMEFVLSIKQSKVDFRSCFISYSHKDEEFAKLLYVDLKLAGIRCWFAPANMKIGDKIRTTIDNSIRSFDNILIILSKNSISSNWVEKEVEIAFEEELNRKKTMLFPLRIDSAVLDTQQPWASDIRRTRHIGDFSQWKQKDAYKNAFERLLRDLKEGQNVEDAT